VRVERTEMLRPTQVFFPEVQFSAPSPVKSPELIPVDNPDPINLEHLPVVVFERITDITGLQEAEDDHVEELGWSRRRVMADYRDVLSLISHESGVYLPTAGRQVLFVDQRELMPKNPLEREFMMARYGKDIFRTIIGDCKRRSGGMFRIRLGFRGQEENTTEEDVISVLAHEHGHTLGEHLKDPVFEEMKADAFEALFMSVYLGTDYYCLEGESPDRIHDIARHNIGLLQAKDIREEEMLAHLTSQPFGRFEQDDYKKRLQ